MRPQQSFKKGGHGKHAPTPGSTLPKSMQEELETQGKMKRSFFLTKTLVLIDLTKL
jgi:hypothetical protein